MKIVFQAENRKLAHRKLDNDTLLQVDHLKTVFETSQGLVRAVNDVSFSIKRKSVFCLVGESGCGKSMTALSIMGLIPSPPGKIASGQIWYQSKDKTVDLLGLEEDQMRAIRGNRIAMIFQEPMTSLNPVFTVGDQIMEAVILHQKKNKKEAREIAIHMLQKVGIPNPEKRVDDYPHQLSGGMRQRVMIAMALSCNPELLIADEPTTALDVTIQAQIMELMASLIEEFDMSLLLITHDLGLVAEYADTVAVMYAGEIIEQAPTSDIFKNAHHPYTLGLLGSIPKLGVDKKERLQTIPGAVPMLNYLPNGCYFQDRCEKVIDDCKQHHPLFFGDQKHPYRCFNPYGIVK